MKNVEHEITSIGPFLERRYDVRLLCFHCQKVSVFPVEIGHPFYSYKVEKEYWEKRCLELGKELRELKEKYYGS